jgi:isopentenyl-diphosphate Delta-isomerase
MMQKKHKFHDLKGESKKQMLTLVDKRTGKRIGQATREECHFGSGKPHLAFMAFILDAENDVILAKRASIKSLWANYWDSAVVSHVLENETPEISASRRAKEEMGVEMKFHDLGAFYYFAPHEGNSAENEYCHVLIGKTNEKLSPNPVEISETKKISLSDLKKELENDDTRFAPWFILAMKKFDLKMHIIRLS